MNKKYAPTEIQFSNEKNSNNTSSAEDSSETGLTDDERVIREDEFLGGEARVEPGPADLERIKKP